MTEHIWAARRGDLELIRAELGRGAMMREGLADVERARSYGAAPEEVASEDDDPDLDFIGQLLAESMAGFGLDEASSEVALTQGEEHLWWPVVHAAHSSECDDDAFDMILQWTVGEGSLDPHQGAQALTEAARRGAIRCVRSLLAAGANANGRGFLGTAVPDALPYRKSDGAIEALKAILDAGDFHGRDRIYLVNQAVSFGNHRAVALLRDEGDAVLRKGLVDQHGTLGHALICGKDVDVATVAPRSDEEERLFRAAACLDRVDVVSRGLPGREHLHGLVLGAASGADSSAVLGWCLGRSTTDEQMQEALVEAAGKGSGRAMELLLDAGAVPEGDTIADARGDAARVLARRAYAINTVGSDGFTILRTAAGEGDHRLVRDLLEHGADPNAGEDGLGFTALGCAASHEWARCAEILLKHGADPMIQDFDGDRPVDCARSKYLKDLLTKAMA